jgi:hypothetical protein
MRGVFSARPSAPLRCRLPGVFGADLLTGLPRRRRAFALPEAFLSGPPDLGVLVRNSKNLGNWPVSARSALALVRTPLARNPHFDFGHSSTRREDPKSIPRTKPPAYISTSTGSPSFCTDREARRAAPNSGYGDPANASSQSSRRRTGRARPRRPAIGFLAHNGFVLRIYRQGGTAAAM